MKKSVAKKRAWTAFSKYIRLRDALKTTGTTEKVMCVTCRRLFPAFGVGCAQAGHMVSGRTNSVLFDEEIVFAQCISCNVYKHGNLEKYILYMIEKKGKSWVEKKINLKYKIIKYTKQDYLEIEKKYKKKYEELWTK